jgi:hypothetical protein
VCIPNNTFNFQNGTNNSNAQTNTSVNGTSLNGNALEISIDVPIWIHMKIFNHFKAGAKAAPAFLMFRAKAQEQRLISNPGLKPGVIEYQ